MGEDRRPRVLSAPGITAVCVAVAIAAAVATAFAAMSDGAVAVGHPLAFVVIVVLLSYTHIRPNRLMHRHGTVESDHLDEVLFAPMVLMLGSLEVAAAVAIASLTGNVAARRAPVKTVFNVGQTVLACLAGYAVARAMGAGPGEEITPMALLGCCVGGVVFAGVSSYAVAVIVRLAAGHPVLRTMVEQWRTRSITSFGALFLGVVAGAAIHDHPSAAIPAVVLAWTVERSYVAIVLQRQARLAAEARQEALLAIRRSSDPEEVRGQLLEAATTVLHAESADFVAAASTAPHGTMRADIDAGTALQVGARVGGGSWLDSEQDTLDTLASVGAEALRNANLLAHLTAITDGQSEGVIAMDAAGVITFANPAARRLLSERDGDGPDGLVGRSAGDVFAIERANGSVDLTVLAGAHSDIRDDDALLRVGHQRTPVAFTAAGLAAPQTGVVVVLHDITERKALEGKLTYLAFHDPLTDLPNRRLFDDRLDHALIRAQRHGTRHALLMVDLDRFKLVNDSYGHPAGDGLLVHVAKLLRRAVRPEDTCARLGGDEFAILVEDIADVQEPVAVAESILEALAAGCLVEGHEVFVSASVGIATSDQADSREALVAAADAAVYDAKASGKGRYQIFAPATTEDPRARLELEAALRRGLEHGEFVLHYQPLVATAGGRTLGAEALVRWRSPDGLVPPLKFIPLAEETGLITPLGAWVLEEACRQAHAWTREHPELPPLRMSVNLSAQQLNRPSIVEEVQDILTRTGLPAEQLCLEITETVIMSDAEAATTTLTRLKELGIGMAIDDFGTGYSSLSYLKRFPLDVVKVDRTFTAGLGENAVDSEIVAAVVRLAAARGITVVAEGVETEDQRRALDRLGCPVIQGFLVAQPLPADEFAAFWTGADAVSA